MFVSLRYLYICFTLLTMAFSLRIGTYNIHGFNENKSDYLQTIINNHDIILLQEHWLFNSQSHLFQDQLSGISSYSVSGMNETILKYGRGFGGCAILWKTSLACNIEPVKIDNTRICTAKFKLLDAIILLCSVYMPCDTRYDDHNVDAFVEVFNDIFHNDICNNVTI